MADRNLLEEYDLLFGTLKSRGSVGEQVERRFFNACLGLFRARAERIVCRLKNLPPPDVEAAAAEVSLATRGVVQLAPELAELQIVHSALNSPQDGVISKMLTAFVHRAF